MTRGSVERSLFVADENGETKQQRAFDVMNEKGLLFEAEGATFFRSTDYGDDKDRVLVKPTVILPIS